MAARLWWIIHKDLIAEWRARRAWPAMVVLGAVVALLVSLQMDLLPNQQQRIVGGLLWLAIFFSGMIAVDRSFAAERENDAWTGLLLYPVSPSGIYCAKLVVNVIALAVAQVVLIPLFMVLSNISLLAHPFAVFTVALLGNIGIAAVGTLLSALAAGMRRGNLVVILVLPMVIPVLIAAAEATRLVAEGQVGAAWWQWTELLGAFCIIFVTAGLVLFEFVIEE